MRYKHSLPPKLLQASSVQADTKSWYPHTWPPVARSLSIISLGRYVRFIRSIVVTAKGTAVTHRFNYPKRPLYIFNFYIFNFSLRYGQVGLLQRGFDSMSYAWSPLQRPCATCLSVITNPLGMTVLSLSVVTLSKNFFACKLRMTKRWFIKFFFFFFFSPPKYTRASLHRFFRATVTGLYSYQKNEKMLRI